MVRRSTGLFAGFDLENNHCLQELAIALEYWLAGGRDRHDGQKMKELSPLQKSTVEMIAQKMAHSPLLTEIITPFLQVPRFGGTQFLTAARDLADYAIPQAEEPRAAEYRDALAAWQNRRPLRMANSVLPDHEARTKAALKEAALAKRRRVAARGVVVDDGDTDNEVKAKKKRKKSLLADAAVEASKGQPGPSQPGTSAGCRRSTRLTQDDPPRVAKDQNNSRANGSKGNGFYAPRRLPDDTAVDDGTIDFKGAKVGVEDLSKLALDFNTTRPDPSNPGSTIPGDRVYNRFHLEVDFNDKESVKRLNTWRRQILSRNLPQTRKIRAHWLESEMEAVVALIKEQLESDKYVRWNRLTNNYNRGMAGVIQHAGQKFLANGSRKSEILQEERKAPWRTKSAIMAIAYKWQMHDLVEAYIPTIELGEEIGGEGEDGQEVENSNYEVSGYSSGDDEEIPNPNLGPSDCVRQRKKTSFGQAGTSLAKNSTQARGQKRKRQGNGDEDEDGETTEEGVGMNG